MVDKINGDVNNLMIINDKISKTEPKAGMAAQVSQPEVSTKLSDMAKEMLASSEIASPADKIADLKARIDNDAYVIDTDKLATKLYSQLFSQGSSNS